MACFKGVCSVRDLEKTRIRTHAMMRFMFISSIAIIHGTGKTLAEQTPFVNVHTF